VTPSLAGITVIIPTLALAQRRPLLQRCLDSVHAQQGVTVHIVVVVNGRQRDEALLRLLADDPRLELIVSDHSDLPAALRLGRARVETPWFTSIDDDDTLLAGALARRLAAGELHPEAIAVVTNGLRRSVTGDVRHLESFDTIRPDPLQAMLDLNWLLPGSWLCRTSAVPEQVFGEMPRYLECTYLGLRLSLMGPIVFLDEPTVAWSTDTPGSLSKSREYLLGQPDALERLLSLPLPTRIHAGLSAKVASALHGAAALHLQEGRWRAAWRSHCRCLQTRTGWRYGAFTLRLLTGSRAPPAKR